MATDKSNNNTKTNEEEISYSFFTNLGGLAGDAIEASKILLNEIENIPTNLSKGFDTGLYIDPIITQTNKTNTPKIEHKDLTTPLPLTDIELDEEIARLHRIKNTRKK